MSFVAKLISLITILSWPCLLILLYTKFPTPTRFIIQTIVIIPILLVSSSISSIISVIIKYLPSKYIPITSAYRTYLLSQIAIPFHNLALFCFEFWPNNKYVVSDEGVSDDIFYLNNIIICNHSASPLDWVTGFSVTNFLNRSEKTYSFAKKEIQFIPIMGTIAITNGVLLNRSWDKDKQMIADLCKEFKKGIKGQFKYTSPWCFSFYPEGTRFTHKKLLKAQQFARDKGLVIYDNLLQPRVKGFSYMASHLHDVLGCMIDVTCVYHPKPPSAMKLLLYTRTAKYTHLHLKVYRQDDIPKDINDLNQWLRDRWTEKDKLIVQMKEKKVKWKILNRSPNKAIAFYIVWALIFNYFVSFLIIGDMSNENIILMVITLISSIFPWFIIVCNGIILRIILIGIYQ